MVSGTWKKMPNNESTSLAVQSSHVTNVDIFGPWGPHSRTTILLLCQGATQNAVRQSLKSLFESSVQNFDAICIDAPSSGLAELTSWTESDPRINFATALPAILPSSGAILVIRAGWILTPFSLLALWEGLALPGTKVLRSVTEGVPGTLEFWNAAWLVAQGERAGAESMARSLGVERWISAEGLGIHAVDLPAPRVFFRRGAADKHVVDVVVYDAADRKFLARKDNEINGLKKEIRELNRIMASQGTAQPTVLNRIVMKIRRRVGRVL